MGRILNLMAFVIFATTLFMRSVDPVIPQIAQDLKVTTTTAALLSTGFTLPYALVQPVLGALADMFSKTRLIALCMLIVGVATLACGLATNFETLMALRVLVGVAAGGVFPIALDGFSQLFSQYPYNSLPLFSLLPYRESTPLLRTLTGGLFGLANAWLAYPYFEESMQGVYRDLEAKLARVDAAREA